jgi:hypothetical protein
MEIDMTDYRPITMTAPSCYISKAIDALYLEKHHAKQALAKAENGSQTHDAEQWVNNTELAISSMESAFKKARQAA